MEKSEIIKELNDKHRENIPNSKTLITKGVKDLGEEMVYKIIQEVKYYTDFRKGNDPYGEHDFGSLKIGGNQIYWKIDYYDTDYNFGSEDASNAKITGRLLTIMNSNEY
ncbi:MAG: DUF3768 domain-containing protein [Candidatus Gracilibacteria bacterium]|nr:DUF3768 domain-containing protein [Candidatus Gracilibacteria bacterium]